MSLALPFAATYTSLHVRPNSYSVVQLYVAMLECFMAGLILEERTLGRLGSEGSERQCRRYR